MKHRAFTLIELLVVVAIIAILAAIAVPNFPEAQTPSKIARSQADMRTIDTGIRSYIVDWNNEPKALGLPPGAGAYSSWWGFVSPGITTPVAHLASIPRMTFTDETVTGFWKNVGGSGDNQPYTVIRNTCLPAYGWPGGMMVVSNAPPRVLRIPIPFQFNDDSKRSSYIIYTGGADGIDSTV